MSDDEKKPSFGTISARMVADELRAAGIEPTDELLRRITEPGWNPIDDAKRIRAMVESDPNTFTAEEMASIEPCHDTNDGEHYIPTHTTAEDGSPIVVVHHVRIADGEVAYLDHVTMTREEFAVSVYARTESGGEA